WSCHSTDARKAPVTEALATALAAALAGRQRIVLAPPGKTVAAVLVPLLAVDGEPSLLFTRRSNLLPHHQGQIAFPGGGHDPEDPDLAATALREAHEEIGLDPADVRLLGPLDDLETVATRFVITPFVGVVPHPYDFRPSPDEVDLVRRGPEVVGVRYHAHEGRDDEAGGHRLEVVERTEEADVGRVEADLLVRLAQRGRGQVRVLGIVAAAGERDLALMVRQEVRAPGEEQARLAVDGEQRHEHGGDRLAGRREDDPLASGERGGERGHE